MKKSNLSAQPGQKPTVTINWEKTYLLVIKNSLQSKIFQSMIASVNGKEKDITEKGELSCAFYLTAILTMFGLLDKIQATVHRGIKAMEEKGFKKIKKPKPGDIIVWDEEKTKRGMICKHMGFYIGNKMAVSHRDIKKCPIVHHWTYGEKNGRPKRKIIAVYRPSFK